MRRVLEVLRTRPVRYANLRRGPYSRTWGKDRGTPIDRVYIDDWFAAHRDRIRGHVLEIAEDHYVRRFATPTAITILDIRPENPKATLIADLCEPDSLPARRFDTILLTQTLQLLPEPGVALRNLHHSLSPQGSLFVTVPVVSRLDYRDDDYWRWTPRGFERFVVQTLDVKPDLAVYGNASTAAAFMLGLSAQNLGRRQLRIHDSEFPVTLCAVLAART